MLYALICTDKPHSLQVRLDNRPAHIEFLKDMGDGLYIRYGVHRGFLGDFVIAATDRGICGLQFFGPEGPDDVLADMRRRFPGAEFRLAQDETRELCEAVFRPGRGDPSRPLRLWYKGTNFQIKVWQALLSIPLGRLVTYGDIARAIGQPSAARAVGSAVRCDHGHCGKAAQGVRHRLSPLSRYRPSRRGSGAVQTKIFMTSCVSSIAPWEPLWQGGSMAGAG